MTQQGRGGHAAVYRRLEWSARDTCTRWTYGSLSKAQGFRADLEVIIELQTARWHAQNRLRFEKRMRMQRQKKREQEATEAEKREQEALEAKFRSNLGGEVKKGRQDGSNTTFREVKSLVEDEAKREGDERGGGRRAEGQADGRVERRAEGRAQGWIGG